jgi:MFS family permease
VCQNAGVTEPAAPRETCRQDERAAPGAQAAHRPGDASDPAGSRGGTSVTVEGGSGATGAGGPRGPLAVPSRGYSSYVLGVLVLVYVLNFLDRQIITILAEDIKADLGIGDAQIGFLYGTAFAVFYAIFGIPLGRLADVWSRRTLIALGLTFWSLATAASGAARTFGQLAAARVCVGVGEASATPAAFSMLSDTFSARVRSTVLAIYSSGIYIGGGLGLLIGGQVVERWNRAFAGGEAPLGLVGWQAAYLAVGLPGALLALWVVTLREPMRGAAGGIPATQEPHPFREMLFELRSVLPPLTVLHLWRTGAGARRIAINLASALAIALAAWGLTALTHNPEQWAALGIGVYAAVSWMQALGLRDRPAAALIFGSPALRYAAVGFAFLSFTGYGVGAFTPAFFQRIHAQPVDDVGLLAGGAAALGGFLGVTLGGILADVFRRRLRTGRLVLGMLTAVLPVPVILWMLGTQSVNLAYGLNLGVNALTAMWIGAGASTVQDLVLPRMRAVASAFYLLVITFIGLALGPYVIGQLSDVLGDLALAMRLALLANAVALLCLLMAARYLARDEASLLARARRAGEPL